MTGGHDGATPVLEGEKAENPTTAQERAADAALILMKVAPVAHQHPPCMGGDESAEGRYPRFCRGILLSVGFT